MAKIYGDRWKTIENLGSGGQSEVFKVEDITGALPGEYALKRLRDVNRLDRFKKEIEALKLVQDERIIKLVDHSDLSDPAIVAHYLVMPIAQSGDAEKRLSLFVGSIDNVARVSLQLAKALEAAHAAEVIHRDVKPGNILFPNEGFDIWLSDFGICRLDKGDRDTPDGVVMGPRRFAAPEIEQGGGSDVSKSVDIYSLGQVIFYLLSGGRTFHREDVFAKDFDSYFPAGEQSTMLRLLLAKMVAPVNTRLTDDVAVAHELQRILDWKTIAQASVLTGSTRQIFQDAQRQLREKEAKASEENAQRAARADLLKSVRDNVHLSIETAITTIANELKSDNDYIITVSNGTTGHKMRLGGTVLWNGRFTGLRVAHARNLFRPKSIEFWTFVERVVAIRMQGEDLGSNLQKPQSVHLVPLHSAESEYRSRRSLFTNEHLIVLREESDLFTPNLSAPQKEQKLTVKIMTFTTAGWPECENEVIAFAEQMIGKFFGTLASS